MTDIDALEALAKAATPGPWTVDEECLTDRGCLYVAKGKPGDLRGRVLEVFKNCLVRDAGRASNADFIAAANPDAILVLIAEVRALREDAERYQWFQEWFVRGGKLSEIDPLGHIRFTTPEIINSNIDAARGAQ